MYDVSVDYIWQQCYNLYVIGIITQLLGAVRDRRECAALTNVGDLRVICLKS